MSIEGTNFGGAAMWLNGFIRITVSTIKDQEFLHRLPDILHAWDMAW